MKSEEMLEAFYVDAGLTEETTREAIAPEGDVERWLGHARLRLGVFDKKTELLEWKTGDESVTLPRDYVRMGSLRASVGSCVPSYDEWGGELIFREAATSDGSALLSYQALFPIEPGESSSHTVAADAACVAMVSYALAAFYRALAGSRTKFQRYSTITGQSGIDVKDLLDLADVHDAAFERARGEQQLQAPSTFYGE